MNQSLLVVVVMALGLWTLGWLVDWTIYGALALNLKSRAGVSGLRKSLKDGAAEPLDPDMTKIAAYTMLAGSGSYVILAVGAALLATEHGLADWLAWLVFAGAVLPRAKAIYASLSSLLTSRSAIDHG